MKSFYDIINQISLKYKLIEGKQIKEEIIKTSDKKVKIEKYDFSIKGVRVTIMGDLKEKAFKHLQNFIDKNHRQKDEKNIEKNISCKSHKKDMRNKIRYYENIVIAIYKR